MGRSYPSSPLEIPAPHPSETISLSGARSSRILCMFFILLLCSGAYCYACSVAIFDVVKSARRTSPFVLLQPRLHLQDIIPHQREYPNDETAFVGLVPETGSLFALGPDNFPLVAFSGPVSAQKVEGIEGTSDEGVLISHEDSRLQCYEGTIDRRCQTGVRALRADSASRIARLLDGVPSPGAPPLPSATGGDGGRPGNTNSQAYPGDEQFIFGKEEVRAAVPWQWISIVPESLVLGRAPSGSALFLTLASMVGTVLWFFKRKPLQKAHVAALPLAEIPVPDERDHSEKEATPNPDPTNNLTQILHSESPAQSAVAVSPEDTLQISSEPLISTPAAEAPPTTDDDDKPSLVKAEPVEGAEDAGEVKKKPRKRRRRRRGEAKDAAADGGDEPENEDGEGGEGDIAAVSGAPSLVPPPTPVPQASTSLIVSDTVLGTSPAHFIPKGTCMLMGTQGTDHMARLYTRVHCRGAQ
jgi:serine/threonine-protein kinase/endoribonuclease IRE1